MSYVAQPSRPDSELYLTDVSRYPRFGCKGPGAQRWLAEYGFPVPAKPNSWGTGSGGVLTARLGTSEFLVQAASEDSPSVLAADRELLSLDTVDAGIYWVCRQDTVLTLSGESARDLMLECCSFDLRQLTADGASSGPLVMTTLLGVAVVIIPGHFGRHVCFRIWCDPSFGDYLKNTLLQLIRSRDA